ncbi:MAG: NUDIX hydrolase, partial [Deltaproteobacteria bacterium]|nr:NUDIX hydrolase [Deltaproteobacteria bacterium]
MGTLGIPEASTVIPVRQGAAGLEVYLVRRSDRSGFMAGHYVFPGGVVDPADRDVRLWAGAIDLGPTALGERLGGGLGWQQAVAFGVAAIRETFEEAGVLLGAAGDPDQLARVRGHRREGVLGREWLAEGAATGSWTLSFSALSRWAWWITPEGMKRRYDTRFFVAPFPPDQ